MPVCSNFYIVYFANLEGERRPTIIKCLASFSSTNQRATCKPNAPKLPVIKSDEK